ncbi:MAG: AAA family ATPase [Candidatus Methanomethylophilaceae archaeon]|nr:AAA family ATPase [Candidatus Methanomethylophilaceae archaeon]
MIKRVSMRNFLCFKETEFDLSGTKGEPLPYALVYGENGSGKTNLMMAQRFLRASLDTMPTMWMGTSHIGGGMTEVPEGITMKNLFSDYMRVGSSEPMTVEFVLRIKGKDATYRMFVTKDGLTEEELVYVLNGRRSVLFSITEGTRKVGEIFSADLEKEMLVELEKYWGPSSFLSMIYRQYRSTVPSYVRNNMSPEILEVINEVINIRSYFSVNHDHSANPIDNPKSGQMPLEMEPYMDALGEAMRDFFCGLYSDIVDVRYVKRRDQRYIDYELVFDKRVEGEVITLPYYRESTGTQKLVDEFLQIMSCVHGDTVLVDEMDSGIHDVLMSGIFDRVRDSMRGQLIATTHNTMLLQNSDPKCTFILDIDGEGYRHIRSVKSITTTQKCNNNTKRYLEGDLGGIPILGYVDLAEISDRLFERLGQ